MQFLALLYSYFLFLFGFYVLTVWLIFLGVGWGPFPHWYLCAVRKLQNHFQSFYPPEYWDRWPFVNILDISQKSSALSRSESRLSDFEIIGEPNSVGFDVILDLTDSALESIVEDDLGNMFGLSPDLQKYELSGDLWRRLDLISRILFVLALGFRCGILFPIRLALYISSFVFVSFCCISALFVDFSAPTKTWIAVKYCRLYTAGCGLVARYHQTKNRPQRPGIAVANHFSPNDIQIICADVPADRDHLYIVTGQKHSGIIWVIERLVEKLCPSMWLERADADERLSFMKEVLEVAKSSGPVLTFPEGYCTNNTQILQFRKAVFDEGVRIHPIAIRQDSRFGDSYWNENRFQDYLLRLLMSWATVYDIYYLEAEYRREEESHQQFAERIQRLIGEQIQRPVVQWDGGVWYKKAHRDKRRLAIQQSLAIEVLSSTSATPK